MNDHGSLERTDVFASSPQYRERQTMISISNHQLTRAMERPHPRGQILAFVSPQALKYRCFIRRADTCDQTKSSRHFHKTPSIMLCTHALSKHWRLRPMHWAPYTPDPFIITLHHPPSFDPPQLLPTRIPQQLRLLQHLLLF